MDGLGEIVVGIICAGAALFIVVGLTTAVIILMDKNSRK